MYIYIYYIYTYIHRVGGFLRVLYSFGMCSVRQLNSCLKSAMDSAPRGCRSNLFFVFKTIQGFFKWGQQHSKNGEYMRALIMPLLVSYSLMAHWAKQVTFLPQTHGGGRIPQACRSGRVGCIASHRDSSLL